MNEHIALQHEMIHAYCFVLNIREGNGGHGPNFKRIMETINKVAGTNITVYHSFHDEVNNYKTHIWRCNGVCQFHNPFFGWVKRTSNRAPGPSDQWWEKHVRDCGGTFEKVSEPAKPAAKPKAVAPKPMAKFKKTASDEDIRNFFEKPKLTPKTTPKVVPSLQPAAGLASAFPPTSYPGLSSNPMAGLKSSTNTGRRTNVIGFKDLGSSDEGSSDTNKRRNTTNEMQGPGYNLTNSRPNDIAGANQSIDVDRQHLRDVWSKRFDNNKTKTEDKESKKPEKVQQPTKRRRVSTDLVSWESYDDDVMVAGVDVPVIQISDTDSDYEDESKQPPPKSKPPISSMERTINIKREVMEDESMYSDDDIFMIDDEYDDGAGGTDELSVAAELADQSIIDDLFGEDTLLQEFQRENDVVPCSSRYQHDEANDITTCPICFEKMRRSEFANHLEGCSIIVRVKPPTMGKSVKSSNVSTKSKTGGNSKYDILKECGYSDADIAALDLSSSSDAANASTEDDRTPRQKRQSTLFKSTQECPRCGQDLMGHQLEAHRKICKRKKIHS